MVVPLHRDNQRAKLVVEVVLEQRSLVLVHHLYSNKEVFRHSDNQLEWLVVVAESAELGLCSSGLVHRLYNSKGEHHHKDNQQGRLVVVSVVRSVLAVEFDMLVQFLHLDREEDTRCFELVLSVVELVQGS